MRAFRFACALVLCASVACLAVRRGHAGDKPNFPTKAIEVIVPWDAGGGADIQVRAMASNAQKFFGQPWMVVNRGGAGGVVATTEFLKARNDGYHIIYEAIGVFSTQPKLNKVAYSIDDFEPLAATTVDPLILVTNTATGIKNIDDLRKYMADNPVKLGYTGKGSLHHVGWTAVMKDMNAKLTSVSYDGGGELVAALLGDHVQFASLHPINIASHKDSKSFIPLMVLSPERIRDYPDVPTAKELGMDYVFEVWRFFLAPKGTAPEIRKILADGIQAMMQDPDVRKQLETAGNTILNRLDTEYVADRLASEIAATGTLLDEMGLSRK